MKSCQEFIRQPLWDFHPLPPLVADLRYQRHQRPFIVLLWPEDFCEVEKLNSLCAHKAGIEPPIPRSVGKRVTTGAKLTSRKLKLNPLTDEQQILNGHRAKTSLPF